MRRTVAEAVAGSAAGLVGDSLDDAEALNERPKVTGLEAPKPKVEPKKEPAKA
jgi:hypothetical protein